MCVQIAVSDVMEGIQVYANLDYDYSGGLVYTHGTGDLIINNLHDDGSNLHLEMYQT